MTPTQIFLTYRDKPGDADTLRAAYLKALTGNASVRHWLENASTANTKEVQS